MNSFTFGYFGRIVPEKGLLILLKTLQDIKLKSWKLLIDDFSRYTTPYINEVKEYIRKNNLDSRVVFFHANHYEIAHYMNACDLIVVPSYTTPTFKEQYGRVVQEAVACGCLTIVSDSGFLPHFFEDMFHIFAESNVDSLSKKIEQVLALDSARITSLKEKSIQNIQKKFSISAQASAIEGVVNS